MIVSPHVGQGLDGTVHRICEQIDSSIPIVPVTRIDNYEFNTGLYRLTDYVLFDYVEYGWNEKLEETGTHFFGRNTDKFHQFDTPQWKQFDEWVKNNPPKKYFKRELLNRDIGGNVVPIDYPCWLEKLPPIVSKKEFDERAIEVFFFWGRSHEERLKLHSEFWLYGSTNGINICDNLNFLYPFLQNEQGRKWVTVNLPHYSRFPIDAILSVNALSKISVAMPGAGRKTFRGTGESPVNSTVLLHEDNMAYSYEWEHNKNCIRFKDFGDEIDAIEEALRNPLLYEIYCESVRTCEKYLIRNYKTNYIEKIINESL